MNTLVPVTAHACESLPRKAEFAFVETGESVFVYVDVKDARPFRVMSTATDYRLGDGYRWYQVFCLAFAAVLGWSPILRDALGVKRRSNRRVEKGEDGVRAQMIEEYVIALAMAEEHWLHGEGALPDQLLQEIRQAVAYLEVSRARPEDWQQALAVARSAWQVLAASGDAIVVMDRAKRNLRVTGNADAPVTQRQARGDGSESAARVSVAGQWAFRLRETKAGVVEIYRELAGGAWVNTGSKAEEWSLDPADGFRWHDAFHLANLALVRWSPVCEALCQHEGEAANSLRRQLLEEAIIARAFDVLRTEGPAALDAVANRAEALCETFGEGRIAATSWNKAFHEAWQLRDRLMQTGDGLVLVDADKGTIELRHAR